MPTLAQLKTEITTDPKSLGYAALRALDNGPEALAAKLNERGASAETLTITWLDTAEVTAAIVGTEVIALNPGNRDLLGILTSTTRVKTGSATMRASLGAIFGASTTSRANLLALSTRSASRAEALWGEGTNITASDVGNALEG